MILVGARARRRELDGCQIRLVRKAGPRARRRPHRFAASLHQRIQLGERHRAIDERGNVPGSLQLPCHVAGHRHRRAHRARSNAEPGHTQFLELGNRRSARHCEHVYRSADARDQFTDCRRVATPGTNTRVRSGFEERLPALDRDAQPRFRRTNARRNPSVRALMTKRTPAFAEALTMALILSVCSASVRGPARPAGCLRG